MGDVVKREVSRPDWVKRGWVLTSRVLAVAVLISAGTGGVWLAKHVRSLQQKSVLTVAESALDFGEVWEDTSFTWELPVENAGSSDLRVVEFLPSCGCLAIHPPALTIPARQTRNIRLTLDLTANPPTRGTDGEVVRKAIGAIRDFSVQINPRIQGPHGGMLPPSVVWTVKGRVRPVLRVEPRAVGFGDNLVQGQPCAARSVRVTTHAAVQRVEVKCQPDLAKVQIASDPEDGSRYQISIQPKAMLPLGPVRFRIDLMPYTSDGPLPRFTIPVEGRVVADIQASPAGIQFGACRLGQTVCESIVLRSVSGRAFEVERVESSVANAIIEAVKFEAVVKEYRVTQRIARQEEISGTIRFHVRLKSGAAMVVPVPLSYLGVAE